MNPTKSCPGRGNILVVLSAILAVVFTIYLVLDTFVISHAYQTVTPAVSAETLSARSGDAESATVQSATAAVTTDTFYCDENIEVALTTYREYDTDIYVADIQLSSPEYLKTAYNLDGGGSSTLYFNGQVINNPVSGSGKRSGKGGNSSSGSSERSVSDIVYIG